MKTHHRITYSIPCWKCRGIGFILEDINKPQLPCYACGCTGKIQKTFTEYVVSTIPIKKGNKDA